MKSGVFLFFLLLPVMAKAGECDFIKYNQCVSCDGLYAISVGSDEACAYLCPNREANNAGSGSMLQAHNCGLKECPPEAPFKSKFGSCSKSQEEDDDAIFWIPNLDFEENIQDGEYSTAPLSINGQCPQDRPLLYSGKCFTCEESSDLNISKEECQKCPNRVYNYYPNWRVESCALTCPANKPLRRWDGTCFPCDDKRMILLQTHCNIEQDCEHICPNRTIVYEVGGNVPSVINCPPDKPLMDSEGICFSCDAPVAIGLYFNTDRCMSICPGKRYLDGDECKLRN